MALAVYAEPLSSIPKSWRDPEADRPIVTFPVANQEGSTSEGRITQRGEERFWNCDTSGLTKIPNLRDAIGNLDLNIDIDEPVRPSLRIEPRRREVRAYAKGRAQLQRGPTFNEIEVEGEGRTLTVSMQFILFYADLALKKRNEDRARVDGRLPLIRRRTRKTQHQREAERPRRRSGACSHSRTLCSDRESSRLTPGFSRGGDSAHHPPSAVSRCWAACL